MVPRGTPARGSRRSGHVLVGLAAAAFGLAVAHIAHPVFASPPAGRLAPARAGLLRLPSRVAMRAEDDGAPAGDASAEPAAAAESELTPEEELIARERLSQIKAAIARGEARAAQAEEDGTPIPARQMTAEEEEMLKKFTTQLGPDGQPAEDPADGAGLDNLVVDAEVLPATGPLTGLPNMKALESLMNAGAPEVDPAIEERMRKTLEFCPDGRLARDILVEVQANCTRDSLPGPGAGAYDEVLEAFSNRGAIDDALALFQVMQKARIGATDRTYDAVARPAARGGEYRFVEMLYGAKAADRQGDIGSKSLALLLEAYANGLPRQAKRAESAFRSAMEFAAEQQEDAPAALAKELAAVQVASESVLAALRRAVGADVFQELLEEFGLDPDEAA